MAKWWPFGRTRKLDADLPTPAPAGEGGDGGAVEHAQALMDQQVVPGLSLQAMDAWAQGAARARADGWMSAQTGIGTHAHDKRLSHKMRAPHISYQDAIELWRSDKIARRAIEAPIDECFRQGYDITIADEGKFDDLKEAVEDKIAELKLNEVIKRAKCMERALGGSAILLGVNDSRPLDTPLNIANVTSIDWLTVLEPIELQPASYYSDPESAKYGEVEFYELTTFTTAGQLAAGGPVVTERAPPPNTRLIHETRLLVFGGIKVSRYQLHHNVAGSLWGDSILTGLVESLRDFNVAFASAGLLAVDFGQPVISVDNLMLLIAKNPAEFYARMRALEDHRSTARAILIDAKKEKFERQGTNLNGFPELLSMLSTRLAADVDMPLTLLMGQSPKGLGNEGESDVRFYYDRIKGKQTQEIGPLIRFFVKLIMGCIRKRKLPKKWSITFHELWQMTTAELAEARLTQARTDSIEIKSGVVFADEIRKSRHGGGYSFETQVDERKKAPGFMAPPPNGTPGSPHNPGPGGPMGGPGGHVVGGYVRKNPTSSGTEPAAKQGGDQSPGNGPNSRKDAIEYDAKAELEYHVDCLRRARERGDSQVIIDLLEQLIEVSSDQLARKRDQVDGDGPGQLVGFHGFPVVIESPKGSFRHWVDTDGTPGKTEMKYDYGYIDGALGADGDSVDVYLGPDETAQWAYVVHQNKRPEFEIYDEDKVMLGFPSADAARDAYVEQYDDPRFFGGMSVIPMEVFRRKIFTEAGKVTNAR